MGKNVSDTPILMEIYSPGVECFFFDYRQEIAKGGEDATALGYTSKRLLYLTHFSPISMGVNIVKAKFGTRHPICTQRYGGNLADTHIFNPCYLNKRL